MKLIRSTNPVHFCFLFLLFWLLLAAPLHGAQYEEEVSTKGYLFVKGIVHSVSLQDKKVTIKQKKGPAMSFFIDDGTLFEGFYKLTDLKRRQRIKIWYKPDQQRNKALKILKPLDLGC